MPSLPLHRRGGGRNGVACGYNFRGPGPALPPAPMAVKEIADWLVPGSAIRLWLVSRKRCSDDQADASAGNGAGLVRMVCLLW